MRTLVQLLAHRSHCVSDLNWGLVYLAQCSLSPQRYWVVDGCFPCKRTALRALPVQYCKLERLIDCREGKIIHFCLHHRDMYGCQQVSARHDPVGTIANTSSHLNNLSIHNTHNSCYSVKDIKTDRRCSCQCDCWDHNALAPATSLIVLWNTFLTGCEAHATICQSVYSI